MIGRPSSSTLGYTLSAHYWALNRRVLRRAFLLACVFLATALLGGCNTFVESFWEGYSSGRGPTRGDYSTLDNYASIALDASPDGRWLVFVSNVYGDAGDMCLLDLKTLKVMRVARTPDYIEATPAFSNDGKSLLYVTNLRNARGSHIYSRSLETNAVKRLTSTPKRNDAMPRYSPDGLQIVFARAHHYDRDSPDSYHWSEWDLYLINKDGTNPRRITRQNYDSVSAPRFSADGKTILYSASTDVFDTLWKVYSLKLGRGHKPKVLINVDNSQREVYAAGSNLVLSPDKRRMAFVSDRVDAYAYELYVGDLKGQKLRRITWHDTYVHSPVFSADGRSIYYLVDKDYLNNFELWRADVDGKHARRIADKRLFSDPLNWKPKK